MYLNGIFVNIIMVQGDEIKGCPNRLLRRKTLISGNFNKLNIDRTKWYTINYDALHALPLGQFDTMVRSDWNDGIVENAPTNTIEYLEILSNL